MHPCTGGDAVILANEKVAERLDAPLVRILGGGEQHNYPSDDIYALVSGCDAFAERMYTQAGCGPEDLDFAQLYDDYPVMAFIQLEGLGITEPGETAEFIRDRGVTVRGGFPINTGGGQLSAGQAGASGGMIGVYEAVAQLRADAGARQVRVQARRRLGLRHGRVRPRPVLQRRHPGQGMRGDPCDSQTEPAHDPDQRTLLGGLQRRPPDACSDAPARTANATSTTPARAARTAAAATSTGWKRPGRGRVVSWTMVHRPHHAGFGPEAPYVFVAVALAEGPLMYSRLAGTVAEDLIGRSVRAVFVDHGPEQKVPFFELEDD